MTEQVLLTILTPATIAGFLTLIDWKVPMKYLFTTTLVWLLLSTQVSHADLIGDTVNALVRQPNPYSNSIINGTATVGPGIEFTGQSAPINYALDVGADSFTLTVSRNSPAGNFTGILDRLELTGIDREIIGVTVAENSSSFSEAVQPVLSFTDSSILIVPDSTFLSADDANGLTQNFIWNIEFAETTSVPEPSGASLLLVMATLAAVRRSKA